MPEGKEGYTPEELEMEKSRAISDAELLERGAEYQEREGEKFFNLTEEQIESLRTESADAVFASILEESGDSDAIESAERNVREGTNPLESAIRWASEGNGKRTLAYLANADLPADLKCKVLGLMELASAEIYAAQSGEWNQFQVKLARKEAKMLFSRK